MIEEQIIRQCQQGDRSAERHIYLALSYVMFAVTMRYAPDRATAEDLLQEGFIRLFRKIKDYRYEGSFEGWARRIFVTVSLGHLRRENSVQHTELPDSLPDLMPLAIEEMQANDVVNYISQLPKLSGTILNLFCVEGYTHQEISAQLGISVENSRITLHRAKLQLAALLKQNGIL